MVQIYLLWVFSHKSFCLNRCLSRWYERVTSSWSARRTGQGGDGLQLHHLSTCPCKQEGTWCFHSLGSLHLPHSVAVIHFNLLCWLLFRLLADSPAEPNHRARVLCQRCPNTINWTDYANTLTYDERCQPRRSDRTSSTPRHVTRNVIPSWGYWLFHTHSFNKCSVSGTEDLSSQSSFRTGPSVSLTVTILLHIISFYIKWYDGSI